MKKTLLMLFILLSTSILANQTVGIGIYSKNTVYHGKNQINFVPLVNLESKRFYIKGYKPGMYFYKEPNFNLSVFIDPIIGYSDFYIKNSNLENGYKITKNRNTFVGVGIAADFIIDRKIFGRIEVSGGDKGIKGEMKFNQSFELTDRVTFTPGINFKYYDKKYINHFLGVNTQDIRNNRKITKVYRGKDTISGGLSASLDYALTEQITATVFGGVELYNNIKDSELVKKEHSYYGGIGIRYSF